MPVIALVVAFHVSPFGIALDRAFFDLASRHPLKSPVPPANSAIVLVDDQTLADVGREPLAMRWPFPRYAFAALIVALDRAGAKSIVLDFTFFENGESEQQDAILASVAACVPSVVLARTTRQGPVFWDRTFVSKYPRFFREPRTGIVDFLADDDGMARRYTAAASLAARPLETEPAIHGLLRWYGGLATLKRNERVPVISAAPFIKEGFDILVRLLNQDPDANPDQLAVLLAKTPRPTTAHSALVRDRVVFVGANASGTFDVKATPVGKVEPGTLIHWTAWANLATGGFINELSRNLALGVAALGILLVLAAGTWRPGVGAPGAAAIVFGVIVFISAYAGLSAGWSFAPATPIAAASLTLLGVAAESFWTEQRRKREIQAMFGSYVDPNVVARLIRDPTAIRLGGDRVPATVYFSDLAGFTDLSEKIPPEQLLEIINLYLQEMSECLIAHGAYIDKYIGDAVMAVFGAPLPNPHHALAACRGALAARRVMAEINDRLAISHGHTLGMRIGINSGDMIVGNLGSERKRNYTVLGDAVNLASRLEAANKEFGTDILLGENTARAVADRLATRPLTQLRVKGKLEAIEVHELIGAPEDLTPAKRAFLARYREGYARYSAREFAAAAEVFARALEDQPDDQVTAALLRNARQHSQTAPPPNWQPILTLETK